MSGGDESDRPNATEGIENHTPTCAGGIRTYAGGPPAESNRSCRREHRAGDAIRRSAAVASGFWARASHHRVSLRHALPRRAAHFTGERRRTG